MRWAREDRGEEVCRILERLREGVEALRATGRDVPALERNAVRLSGTLRALEVQFADLQAVRRASRGG